MEVGDHASLVTYEGEQSHTKTPEHAIAQKKRVIEDFEAVISQTIARITALTVAMTEASDRQKNFSSVIKDDRVKVKEELEILNDQRDVQRKAQTHLNRLLLSTKARNRKEQAPAPKIPTRFKRVATGPAEGKASTRTEKKRKQKAGSPLELNWQTVDRRGKKPPQPDEGVSEGSLKRNGRPRKTSKSRREAVLIRPTESFSYAHVLGEIREKVRPEETDIEVTKIRQTRRGCILLELGADTKDREGITSALKAALGPNATVERRLPETTLEICDLDSYT